MIIYFICLYYGILYYLQIQIQFPHLSFGWILGIRIGMVPIFLLRLSRSTSNKLDFIAGQSFVIVRVGPHNRTSYPIFHLRKYSFKPHLMSDVFVLMLTHILYHWVTKKIFLLVV